MNERLIRHAATLLTIALTASSPARATAGVNGYLQESVGVRTGEGDVIFHRQTLNVKVEEALTKLLLLRAEADAWHDDPDFMNSRVRSRLREGYARLRLRNTDLRIGRVEIAWGEAEGVIISDQVSPFDFENFITPGFDEIRKGVDGVFSDSYFAHDIDLQLLWISHFEPPDFPNPKSPWYPFDSRLLEPTGVSVDVQPFTKPPKTFENSEYGARLSGHSALLDWAFGYLRSWSDIPTLHIRTTGTASVVSASPEHDRYDLLAANVVVPTHGVLTRLDATYEHGRDLQLAPPSNFDPSDPSVAKALDDEFVGHGDIVRALVGVDTKPRVPYWTDADASFQLVHEEVFDPPAFLAIPERTDLVSVLLRASYVNETVRPRLFAIANLRGADTWIQAKVDYQPWDAWALSIELDVFEGHAFDGNDGGVYGMFDHNDMVEATVRFSF